MASSKSPSGPLQPDPGHVPNHWWALLAAGAAAQVFLLGHGVHGDSEPRYRALESLVKTGHPGAERYSVVQPILALPLYLVGSLVDRPRETVGLFSCLVFLLGCAGLNHWLKNAMPARARMALLLLLMAASPFSHHVQMFYGDVLSAVLVACGVAAVHHGSNPVGILLCALGVVNTPAMLPAILLWGLWRGRMTGRWSSSLLPTLLAAVLIPLEFLWRRGSPWDSGYAGDQGATTALPFSGRPGFSYPLILGLFGLLLSPGKGLLFFSPGLWLLGSRAVRRVALLPVVKGWLLVGVGLLVVYAKWWAWYGGITFGPRFLLFCAVPASALLAMALTARTLQPWARVAALVVLALSAWVGAAGAVFGGLPGDACTANNYAQEFLCWYAPEFSPLVWPFWYRVPVDAAHAVVCVFILAVAVVLAVPVVPELRRAFTKR